MDAPIGRDHPRGLRGTCAASTVRGFVTRANNGLIASRPGVCCAEEATACCLGILVVEGGAPPDGRRGGRRARVLRSRPSRALKAWRGSWDGITVRRS
jgi:hypothetical protein